MLPGLGKRLWMQQQQHKPVTEKQDQASTEFWLDCSWNSKSQALLHPDLQAVNSLFEALDSARGATDRVQ